MGGESWVLFSLSPPVKDTMYQKTIFSQDIQREIEDNIDKYIGIYLKQHSLRPESLKRGDSKCIACGRNLRSRAMTLDKRLIELLLEIADYCRKNKRTTFNPRYVWSSDKGQHHKIADFQKLQYFKSTKEGQGLIRKTMISGLWKVTRLGGRFISGKAQLPERSWVFHNKVVDLEDPPYVSVGMANERWQRYCSDWSLDYQIMPYPALQANVYRHSSSSSTSTSTSSSTSTTTFSYKYYEPLNKKVLEGVLV